MASAGLLLTRAPTTPGLPGIPEEDADAGSVRGPGGDLPRRASVRFHGEAGPPPPPPPAAAPTPPSPSPPSPPVVRRVSLQSDGVGGSAPRADGTALLSAALAIQQDAMRSTADSAAYGSIVLHPSSCNYDSSAAAPAELCALADAREAHDQLRGAVKRLKGARLRALDVL